MIKNTIARARGEGGFTMVELVVYLGILSILIGTATYFFVSMRDVSSLNNTAAEIKTVMQRSYNLALNENQKVTLIFWGPGSKHPNTYSIVKADGTSEEPALNSVHYVDGARVDGNNVTAYWIELQEGKGGATINQTSVITFNTLGTILTVGDGDIEDDDEVPIPHTSGSVTVTNAGRSITVSISSNGEVTY